MARLRPEAEQDLADAAAWYEEQRQGLGHDFLDEVLTIRRAVIHRFPFSVYYRVEDATIVVVAVMHGSRNPHRWKSRT